MSLAEVLGNEAVTETEEFVFSWFDLISILLSALSVVSNTLVSFEFLDDETIYDPVTLLSITVVVLCSFVTYLLLLFVKGLPLLSVTIS